MVVVQERIRSASAPTTSLRTVHVKHRPLKDVRSEVRRMAMRLPSPVNLLLGARLADDELVDLRLDGPLVAEIAPAGALRPRNGEQSLDLDGFRPLPAAAEPHAHLDKALTFDEIRPPLGDLGLAIASFQKFAAGAD